MNAKRAGSFFRMFYVKTHRLPRLSGSVSCTDRACTPFPDVFLLRELSVVLCLFASLLLSGCVLGFGGPSYLYCDSLPLAQFNADKQQNVYRLRVLGIAGSTFKPVDQVFLLKPGETISLTDALKKFKVGMTGQNPHFVRETLNHIILMRLEGEEVIRKKVKCWDSPDDAAFPIQAGDEIYIPEIIG